MTRYARIPEHPREISETGAFRDMAESIAQWGAADGAGLRMGMVWGDRGSGKSSMIETVRARLNASNESRDRAVVVGGTFEPAKLDVVEDDLFIAFATWIRDALASSWPSGGEESWSALQELEAKRHDAARFLNYQAEVAVDDASLAKSTAAFYDELARPTELRGKRLRSLFFEERRYVAFIDDVDLAPALGGPLLRYCWQYLSGAPVSILFASDRETLLASVRASLDEDKSKAYAGLASKILAKYISADWYLPTPSEEQRRLVVEEGGSPALRGEGSVLRGDRVWERFVPPLFRKTALREPGTVSDRRRDPDGLDADRPFTTDDVRGLCRALLPRTWRGVNRVYNRLAQLYEAVDAAEDGTHGTLAQAVGTPSPANAPAFVLLLIAFDESFPDVGLYQAFIEDSTELRNLLEMYSDDLWVEPNNPFVSAVGRLPPLQRGRCERLLQQLAWMWQELWQQSATSDAVFLPFSVRGDAAALAKPWSGQFFDTTREVDLREHAGAGAPGAPIPVSRLRDVCTELDRRLAGDGTQLPQGELVVFPRASTVVSAYLGHLLRERLVAAVFGRRPDEFVARRFQPALEPIHTRSLSRGSDGTIKAGRALVILAVGGTTGVSSSTPFFGKEGEVMSFGGLTPYVFATDQGYRVGDEQDVADLVHSALASVAKVRVEGATEIHLGLKMPAALAVLLGTRLNTVHPVELYEYASVGGGARYDWVVTVGGGPSAVQSR